MDAHANRDSNPLKSVLPFICCVFLTGCKTLSDVRVNPPTGTHLMPGTETAEIVAIMDTVAAQFGMRRDTEVGIGRLVASARFPRLWKVYVRQLQSPILARYEITRRIGLFAETLHTYYLIVFYETPEGSITVEAPMPEAHKILNATKMALAKRFGYDRVFIQYFYPPTEF